jgi:two-component system cell cycle response regulator DivK
MTHTILIVEDNPANLKLTTTVLEHAGHRVLHAESAAIGMAVARYYKPDLILMDIQLPGMDGLQATRLLKADAETSRIPIVALTAFAMKGDEERILAAGCDGYIAKPFDYKQFLAQVTSILSRVDMEKQA